MSEFLDGTNESSDGLGGNQTYSPELAQEALETLDMMAHNLFEAHQNHSTVLSLRAIGSGTVTEHPRWYVPSTEGMSQDEHIEEMRRTGFTERFAFKYHNGGLGMAKISGRSPKGEDWHARFQFPRIPGATDSARGRMVVLDTWNTPANDHYSLPQSGSGLPATAYDVEHFVYGRIEQVPPEAKEKLEVVLDLFQDAVDMVINEY